MQIVDYKILNEIGRGRATHAYLAIKTSTKRPVALKILNSALAQQKEVREQFQFKARKMAEFRHNNLMRVYDIREADSKCFYASEYMPGRLRKHIQDGLYLNHMLAIVTAAMSALEYLHQQRFFHGGVKTDNILFRYDGTPVLVDFCLSGSGNPSLMETATVWQPESAWRDRHSIQTDIYDFGFTLYEMLTGRDIRNSLTPPAQAVQLPGKLEVFKPILARMLALDPAQRFESVQELHELFTATVKPKPVLGKTGTALSATSTTLVTRPPVPTFAPPTASMSMTQPPAYLALPPPLLTESDANKKYIKIGIYAATALLSVIFASMYLAPEFFILKRHKRVAARPTQQQTVAFEHAGAPSELPAATAAGPDEDLGRNTNTAATASAAGMPADISRDEPEHRTGALSDRRIEAVSDIPLPVPAKPSDKSPTETESNPLLLAALKQQHVQSDVQSLGSEPANNNEIELNALLKRAEQQKDEKKLLHPSGDNAYETWLKVLQLDSGNTQAQKGRRRFANQCEIMARKHFHAAKWKDSEIYINRGLEIESSHAGLLALRDRLRAALASPAYEEVRQSATREHLDALLEKANQQWKQRKLLNPPGDNAYDTYREVLKVDSRNPIANSGLQLLSGYCANLAEHFQKKGRLDESMKHVQLGLKIMPSKRLFDLMDKINAQMSDRQTASE